MVKCELCKSEYPDSTVFCDLCGNLLLSNIEIKKIFIDDRWKPSKRPNTVSGDYIKSYIDTNYAPKLISGMYDAYHKGFIHSLAECDEYHDVYASLLDLIEEISEQPIEIRNEICDLALSDENNIMLPVKFYLDDIYHKQHLINYLNNYTHLDIYDELYSLVKNDKLKTINEINKQIVKNDLIKFVDSNFEPKFAEKIKWKIEWGNIESRYQIKEYVLDNNLFESKLDKFKFIIKFKTPFLGEFKNDNPIKLAYYPDYKTLLPKKKIIKKDKKPLTPKDYGVRIIPRRTPEYDDEYYGGYYGGYSGGYYGGYGERYGEEDPDICPLCGSLYTGGECYDCGYFE